MVKSSTDSQPTNSLKLKDNFRAILKDYSPSRATVDILAGTKPVFLVGPTAAGRNTLINLLLKMGDYHYIVSDTTRKPRVNDGILEVNGVEYWFKNEADFLAGLKDGEYLEAAIIHDQQVSGMNVSEIQRAELTGKRAVTEIDVAGAITMQKYINNGLFIFLLPPTFDIWIQRLERRGKLEPSEFRRRLESAEQEIETAIGSGFYQFVVNNDINEATIAVNELATGRQPDIEKQSYGIDSAKQLIASIKIFLQNS